MPHPRLHLNGKPIIQLLIDLRLNYAAVSSSLILGGFFGNNLQGFDWKYVALILSIFFANIFGFIINDFYDAAFDLKERKKRARNLFCSPKTKRLGNVFLYASLGFSFFFSGIVSPYILLIIILFILLAFSYSSPTIKLRNRLFWDWIFVFLWKGVIVFAGYFYFFGIDLSKISPFMYGATTIVFLLSLISQISNQIRDFNVDNKINSKNIVQWLGVQTSSIIKRSLLALFYIFSFVFCYLFSLYITIPLMLLNISLYYFINSEKYRDVVENANIWIIIILLEQFKTHISYWFFAAIWIIAVIWIIAMGGIATIRMKSTNLFK